MTYSHNFAVINVLTTFWREAQDYPEKGILQFMPKQPHIRLTNEGLFNAILKAYLTALEKWPEYKLERDALENSFHHEPQIEQEIWNTLYNPCRYITALQPLSMVDRGDFVKWVERERFLSTRQGIREKLELVIRLRYIQSKDNGRLLRDSPYHNTAIPLEDNQVCSCPYMLGIFNLLAVSHLQNPSLIGEGGTGGGYHLANTAHLFPGARIYTFELPDSGFEPAAEDTLSRLHDQNGAALSKRITFLRRDCLQQTALDGLTQEFDFFYFTFVVPSENSLKPYFEKLKTGGVLIAPVGPDSAACPLRMYVKGADEVNYTEVCLVNFTPARH